MKAWERMYEILAIEIVGRTLTPGCDWLALNPRRVKRALDGRSIPVAREPTVIGDESPVPLGEHPDDRRAGNLARSPIAATALTRKAASSWSRRTPREGGRIHCGVVRGRGHRRCRRHRMGDRTTTDRTASRS